MPNSILILMWIVGCSISFMSVSLGLAFLIDMMRRGDKDADHA